MKDVTISFICTDCDKFHQLTGGEDLDGYGRIFDFYCECDRYYHFRLE